jgi:hypothetical protein
MILITVGLKAPGALTNVLAFWLAIMKACEGAKYKTREDTTGATFTQNSTGVLLSQDPFRSIWRLIVSSIRQRWLEDADWSD